LATKGKPAKKVKEKEKSEADVQVKAKEAKGKKEKAESVTVTEVAEVTEPLVVVEIEEAERAEPEEVRAEDIEQELRELRPKEGMKIVVGPPRLTRFERARIIGARALQLSLGAPPLITVEGNAGDSIGISKLELEEKALPISLRRVLPNGQYQDIPIRWLLESN
jgi:DNA-directed RNA polymerase I, II, and III subunit RPABC2